MPPSCSLPWALALALLLVPRGVLGRARSDPAVPSPGDTPKPIAQLPDYLQVCSRSDPDLDDCVRRAVEHLRPRLSTGIPELGVPACEPLRVPALSLDQGRGAVAMRSDYTDIQVWGVPQFQLRSVRIDLARGRLRLRVRFPELRLRCRYRLDGRVLMLPIRGRGDARGNYTVWMNNTCPRSNPNANDCLKHTFEGMFPYLANGIPEVALPPFEPLFMKRLSLRRGGGAVTISGTFLNVLARGPSNSTATFVKLDESRRRLDFGLTIPEIRLEGDYDMRGNILVLPLVGAGKVHMRMTNLTTSSRTRVQIRRVGGREVFHATHMSIDFNVGSLFVHLDNLFGGNKVLGATLNAFLNQHAQTVVADLREPVGEALNVVFLDLMNRMLHRVPLDLWLV